MMPARVAWKASKAARACGEIVTIVAGGGLKPAGGGLEGLEEGAVDVGLGALAAAVDVVPVAGVGLGAVDVEPVDDVELGVEDVVELAVVEVDELGAVDVELVDEVPLLLVGDVVGAGPVDVVLDGEDGEVGSDFFTCPVGMMLVLAIATMIPPSAHC